MANLYRSELWQFEVMKLEIQGMHCQKCVDRVRKAIERVEGARVETVEVGSATVTAGDANAVIAAVRDAGYEARVAS